MMNGQLGTEEFDRSTLGAPDKFFSVGYDFTCGMALEFTLQVAEV